MQVLGISIAHKWSQKTFATSIKLTYPLLSDFPDGDTILAYDVAQYEGRAKRLFARQSFFLIDKGGVVRGVWKVRPPKPGEARSPDNLFRSDPILKLAKKLAGK